jgi:hypothetical protein
MFFLHGCWVERGISDTTLQSWIVHQFLE